MSSQPESSKQSETDLQRQWEEILAAEGLGELTPNERDIPSGDWLDILAPDLARERKKTAKTEAENEKSSGFDEYDAVEEDSD